MRLYNVRKGQFVYYNNELHKVYSVKPFFKQSVHLIRLKDYEQVLTTAKEIDYYKPQHLDSFICNQQRYTLNKNLRAKVGDYILVINPKPDSLDRHHLNAIELVSSLEDNGVISNQQNGIKHNEYWVMVPGKEDNANIIDLQQPSEEEMSNIEKQVSAIEEDDFPRIGDVFQKNNADPVMSVMVVGIQGRKIYLGQDIIIDKGELMDSGKWSYVINSHEQ